MDLDTGAESTRNTTGQVCMKSDPTTEAKPTGMSESARGLWSAFILVHLLCVSVALSANWNRSPLQDRLLNAPGVRSYLRLFHWDSDFVIGFPLTHAMASEDNHRFVVDRVGGNPGFSYPDDQVWPAGFRGQRIRNLFSRLAALAEQNDGELISEFARAVATNRMAEPKFVWGTDPTGRSVMRFERLSALPLDSADEITTGGVEEVFVGDVWRDEQGVVRVNKRVAREDAALVRSRQSAD